MASFRKTITNRPRAWLTRRPALIGGVVVGVLAISGTAFAYWTTTGTGTATATSGAGLSNVTVNQVGTITAMAPGGAVQALDFLIHNAASTPQRVASVAVSITSVVKTSDLSPAVGCSAADFDLVQPTATIGDVPAGDSTFSPSGATIAMKNTGSNQDGCKSMTVNLAFAAS